MTIRSARKLQIIATIILAVVLLITLIIDWNQAQLKSTLLSPLPEESVDYHVTHWTRILSASANLILAVIFLLMLYRHSSPLKWSIVWILLLGAFSVMMNHSIIETMESMVYFRQGGRPALIAYSSVITIYRNLVEPVSYCGLTLMLLAMGGAYGKTPNAHSPSETDGDQQTYGTGKLQG